MPEMTPRQRMLCAYEGRFLDETEPSWITERPIKNFDRDWPAHEHLTLAPPEESRP
jgi:hypothetical protein